MSERLPLSTLLSHALVAFTVEFDNEAEHLLPHRTSRFGATGGALFVPWLTSMVMWWNCMRFVTEPARSMAEIERLAGTVTNWGGMQRWGYIRLEAPPPDGRKRHRAGDRLVHATAGGQLACEIWEPLTETIERRWEERFGVPTLTRLRPALGAIATQLEPRLPDCMPILHYGMSTARGVLGRPPAAESSGTLPALLSQLLVATALAFEARSPVSLAVSADILRVLDGELLAVRELPSLSGISKEAVAMALSFLEKQGLVAIEPGPTRGQAVRVTAAGLLARDRYPAVLAAIEADWREQYGPDLVDALREVLVAIIGDTADPSSSFMTGFRPYPDGWRARIPRPGVLPHFPMVLHRGGYPDGS